MTTDARQPTEATGYAEEARELAEAVWIIGNRVHTYETKKGEIATAILAALQSAHAAGLAKGDAQIADVYQAVGALGFAFGVGDNPHFIRLLDVLSCGVPRDGGELLPFPATLDELSPNALSAARVEGDAAGFERGVRAAADQANLLHKEALFKWQTRSAPYDAGYDDGARKQATSAKERILALR